MKKLLFIILCLCLLLQVNTLFAQEIAGVPNGGKPPSGGPNGGGPPPPGPPPALNDQQKQEVLTFVQKYTPFFYQKLQDLKEIDQFKYEQILMDKYREMLDLKKLQKDDPSAYKDAIRSMQLEEKSMELAEKYRKTNDDNERTKIIPQLKTVLSELFDLREKERERRIKQLEQEIAHLKELLNNRRSNKDSIIQQKINDLTGKNEQLEW